MLLNLFVEFSFIKIFYRFVIKIIIKDFIENDDCIIFKDWLDLCFIYL